MSSNWWSEHYYGSQHPSVCNAPHTGSSHPSPPMAYHTGPSVLAPWWMWGSAQRAGTAQHRHRGQEICPSAHADLETNTAIVIVITREGDHHLNNPKPWHWYGCHQIPLYWINNQPFGEIHLNTVVRISLGLWTQFGEGALTNQLSHGIHMHRKHIITQHLPNAQQHNCWSFMLNRQQPKLPSDWLTNITLL